MLCCSSKENLLREISSLKGTFLKYLTLIILFLCLLSAFFGIGDERIRTIVWNQRTNADNTNDSRLVFNYMLKPGQPPPIWALRWDENSMDVYDISATMDNRIYNSNETKEFLERYHCENLIPTNEAFVQRFVGLLGPYNDIIAVWGILLASLIAHLLKW